LYCAPNSGERKTSFGTSRDRTDIAEACASARTARPSARSTLPPKRRRLRELERSAVRVREAPRGRAAYEPAPRDGLRGRLTGSCCAPLTATLGRGGCAACPSLARARSPASETFSAARAHASEVNIYSPAIHAIVSSTASLRPFRTYSSDLFF